MYALEFKTVIRNKYIELQKIDELMNKQVRIIVLVEGDQTEEYSDKIFSDEQIKIVFKEAENLKVDKDIDIDKICNEVNW